MSEQVEDRLADLLEDVTTDPFGNRIPEREAPRPAPTVHELSAERALRDAWSQGLVARLGEPLQADAEMLAWCEDGGVVPGAEVSLVKTGGGVRLTREGYEPVVLPDDVARHLFLRR